MPDSYSVYEAKTNLSMIVRDSAEHGKVFTVANAQRKSAPRAVVLGEAAVRALLDAYVCHPEWEEDAEKHLWTVWVREIDDWGEGPTKEAAARNLVASAKELAEIYLAEIQMYLQHGRSAEFPYMLKIGLSQDDDEVRKVLGL